MRKRDRRQKKQRSRMDKAWRTLKKREKGEAVSAQYQKNRYYLSECAFFENYDAVKEWLDAWPKAEYVLVGSSNERMSPLSAEAFDFAALIGRVKE